MTRILVLGLLKKLGTMSGYDIQMAMESSQTDKWAYVKPASIYYALRKLEEEKFITFEELQQTGNRSKAIYKITSLGEEEYLKELEIWLGESSVVFPSTLYSVLSFIDDLPKDKILMALDKQEIKVQKLYDDMRIGEEKKHQVDAFPPHVKRIFDNIYAQCELQLNFINELRDYAKLR